MWRDVTGRGAVLVRHNITLLARNPAQIISYLVMPMVLMLVLAPLYRAALQGRATSGSPGNAQAVAGQLVMFSLFALGIVGTALLAERSWRTWDRLRATPARSMELLLGKALPSCGLLVLQQAILVGYGSLVLDLRVGSMSLLAAAVVCWALALVGMGAALASLVRSHGELSAATDIGALVVTCLGGALVPLATMPGWARTAAPASPGYWAMAALRGAIDADGTATATACTVLLGIAVATGAVACWRLTHGWHRGDI